jgi:hypothetical protein
MDFKAMYGDTSGSPFVALINFITRLGLGYLFFLLLKSQPELYSLGNWMTVLAITLYVLVWHTLFWFIGKKFRDFTHPETILTSGSIDTFGQRIFWMIGPQVTSVFIGFFGLFVLVITFFPLWFGR